MIKYNYKKIPNATTATIRVVVNAGSNMEDLPGTAHFLEHMIFKGTLDNSYEEINKKISRLGSTNAYTSSDKTVFHIVTTVEGIKEATETLLEMVTRPAIDVEELEKEKGVILEEYRSSKDDSFGFLYDSACFALTNGETHSILGDENSIKSMSDLVIREFYKKHYTQNNICINLVGNLSGFTEAAFKKIIQKYESNLQTGELQEPVSFNLKKNGTLDEPQTVNLNFPCQQNYVSLWFNAPNVKENLEANLIADIFCNMIGGGFHSLFSNRLREQLALCYSCNIAMDSIGTQKKFIAYAALGEENIDKCILEMKNIIRDVAAGNFSDEVLEISKANASFNMAKFLQTPSGHAAILDDVFEYGFYDPSLDLKELSYEKIKDMLYNVSKDDLQNFALKIINGSDFDVVILKGNLGKPTLFERFKKLFKGERK